MDNYDYVLFDKLRQVGRQMREGRAHGVMFPPGFGGRKGDTAFQREVVLVILSDWENGLRQKELAEHLRISPSTLSVMLDKLEAEEYLNRETDPTDRRATLLSLTDKGKARATELKERRAQMMSYQFRNLTDEDKQALIALLTKMLANNAELEESES